MQLVQSLEPPGDGSVRLIPLDSLPNALPQTVYGGPNTAGFSAPLLHPFCSDLPPEMPAAAHDCGNEFTLLREEEVGFCKKSDRKKTSSNNFS